MFPSPLQKIARLSKIELRKASLAAVIMAAVGSMFDFDAIMEVIKLNKKDAIPMFVTFFLSCYGT